MKISDLMFMSLRNLIRRKFRTFLTVVGVVIGTCAIIVMISLGIGISVSQDEMMKSFGDLTIINVYNYGGSEGLTLDDTAIAKFQAMPNVDVATPFVRFNVNQIKIKGGKNLRYINENTWSIVGVYAEALPKLGYDIEEGEFLSVGKTKKLQMVFGSMTVYQFYDSKRKFNNYREGWPDENGNVPEEPFFQPIGADYLMQLQPQETDSTAKTLEYEFEVVGVLKGDFSKYETIYGTYMPLEDMQRIQAEYNKENGIRVNKNQKTNYDDVRVKATEMQYVSEIEQKIKDMGYQTWSMESQREEMQKSTQQIQMILGILGGVSLFVAAISIANTMVMSVYERTREIGVMKVLGCLVGNVRGMFLFEAGLIGFFGGVVGVGISFLLSFLLNRFGGALSGILGGMMWMGGGDGSQISVIPAWLVLLGMVAATLIGLVSGFYPAYRATKISALEAIKQE